MDEIVVKNLTQDYGHGRGVFDVSFSVKKGEVFGFLGPNGAGKSTTIRHLMGFSKPQNGETLILGKESFSSYTEFMEKVGYLPGEVALPVGISGYQFLDMMKKMKNCKNDEWLNYLLKYFEVDASGETKRMSLGDKRKLAVVAAFLNDPDILILDEPTSGLDLKMQQKFIEFIKNEKKRKKTILLSSHIFREVDATCDKIAIIKDGKIVSEFNKNDLNHSENKLYKIGFKTLEDKKQFVKQNSRSKFMNLKSVENNWVFVKTNDQNINKLLQALSNFKGFSFEHQKETLEDYFMKFYKEDKVFGGVL